MATSTVSWNQPGGSQPGRDEPKVVQPRPKFSTGNSIGMAVAVIILAVLVLSAIRNDNFQWDVVFKYFLSKSIVRGLLTTIELTALSVAIGLSLGTVIAVMRLSKNPVLTYIASAYVWFFRGTPLLVQLIFWFNLSALYSRLSITIPFGPDLVSVNTNAVISPFIAAMLGLGLHAAGYMAEVVRGGILGVDQTQVEAACALGMSRGTRFRKVVWPQALRLIIPPAGNRVISELKDTSLVSVIAIPDVLYSAQIVYSRTYETIPLLIVATLWYLIVVSLLSIGQRVAEKRVGRSVKQSAMA
ncbi:amino acid ABC transporter permease [Spelaeicoccus albus]|uniref:Polar amino acid transport system permease protein n=1 Tax=Spelaeicoccus albus TaxID=1280376 RepID=A0A7Z0D095_9MICO|nr:amino acid ABC transporter permease [Spelaeicoccus albus]NYI67089.1 polar amino acid transport system permease protein [Spelaeicoccus albus]